MASMIIEFLRVIGRIAEPAALVVLLLLAGIVAALFRRWREALLLQTTALAVIAFVSIFPGGVWLALPLEKRFAANPPLPDRVDGIIALGGTERVVQSAAWGQPIMSDATPIIALLTLGRRYPGAKLVFSGGMHPRNAASPTEADIVHDFIHALGLDDSRIIYEARSHNTSENALFSRDLVHPGAGEHWILITQAISMPRAVGVFRRAGWDVIPFPAGYLSNGNGLSVTPPDLVGELRLASLALHEWGGLLIYWLMGYTDELFPE
jgi:uncharacterized SAM-binding protein YcdF (DUF218 family)